MPRRRKTTALRSWAYAVTASRETTSRPLAPPAGSPRSQGQFENSPRLEPTPGSARGRAIQRRHRVDAEGLDRGWAFLPAVLHPGHDEFVSERSVVDGQPGRKRHSRRRSFSSLPMTIMMPLGLHISTTARAWFAVSGDWVRPNGSLWTAVA